MIRLRRPALAVAAAAAVALACASCSTPATTAGNGSSSPSGSSTAAPRLSPEQAAVLLVQCFIGHHLIPKSALAADKDSQPPADSATWLHDGKITRKLRFGDWYSEPGGELKVDGESISARVMAVAANSKAWPTPLCGPIPG